MVRLDSAAGHMADIDGKRLITFSSNNYLDLATHPKVLAAIRCGLANWGFGPGGSRLICGNQLPHVRLEERLAAMFGKQSALIFNSGYAANTAVLSSLPQADDLVIMDKLSHASLIDGARASAAAVRTWPHGNIAKLERLLARGGYRRAFIVTDSLFSMDGDLAPLAALVALKRRYDAIFIVDEAHAFGCIGPDGLGLAAREGKLADVDIILATFSKALGGAGGFAVCDEAIDRFIVNRARGFIFTTAIPAVNCIAAAAAMDIVQIEPARRGRLIDNGKYLRWRCRRLELDIGNSQSYIVPIMVGSPEKAASAAAKLLDHGFLVAPIRPPTVPPGGSRLRISLSSEHKKGDIDALAEMLADILRPQNG